MPKYEIKRWDPVLPDGNEFPMPMIYIKPDEKFIKYAEENKYMVVVTVDGTGTVYDGKPLAGVIDSSGYFPNYRPNFYNKTGYFTITLFAQWKQYPMNGNGTATIRGLKGADAIVIPPPAPYKAPTPIEEMYEKPPEKKCKNLSNGQIGWIVTGILIMFCVLYIISIKRE